MARLAGCSTNRPVFTVEALEDRLAPSVAYAVSSNKLIRFDTDNPTAAQSAVAISGIVAGDSIVGMDIRPQNGQLYGVGYNAGGGGVRLYTIDPRTASATAVGGQVRFTGGGTTNITGSAFGVDFDPTADRLRVVTNSGLNFRMNPNTGALIDGNNGTGSAVSGVNPDGAIDGPTTKVDAAAYTNSTRGASVTTLYTLDSTTGTMYRQITPLSGTQAGAIKLTNTGGQELVFTAANGFHIPGNVTVSQNNAAATGNALALLRVDSLTRLYSVNLTSGVATDLGLLGNGSSTIQGFTVAEDQNGIPLIGLSGDGTQLLRFNSGTPGSVSPQTVTGLASGETLVGIDYRFSDYELYGLGVNAATNSATLYTIDPQTGVASEVGGATGQIVLFQQDGVTRVDLPPISAGYGFDLDTALNRFRVTTGTGLNFRINPATGVPVDGNFGLAEPVPGVNPDAPINGLGVSGITGIGFTNATGNATVNTQYTIDPVSNSLLIQNPVSGGVQTTQVPITVNGQPIDFSATMGFDIPGSVSVTEAGTQANGFGYAALTVNGSARLYRINLTTGAATDLGGIGSVGTTVQGLSLGSGPAGTFQFSVRNMEVSEGIGIVTATITRTNGTAGPVTLTINSTGGTAIRDLDFFGLPATIEFADGQSSATFTFTVFSDTLYEGNEFFNIGFTTIAGGGVQGNQNVLSVTIIDDDPVVPPPPPPGPPASPTMRLGFRPFAVGTNPGRTEVKIYNPNQSLRFTISDPFPGKNVDGVRVAMADVNGDGEADIVMGSGPGGPSWIRVLDGRNLQELAFFQPFESSFTGGVWVAAGDINGDGSSEIVVTPDQGGGPRVSVYNGKTFGLIADFFGIDDPNFRGGARAAIGDMNADGRADLIVSAGFLGGPRIAGYSGASISKNSTPVKLFSDFFAFEETLRNGAFVSVGDVNGDGFADLVFGGGPGGSPRIRIADGQRILNAGSFGSLDELSNSQIANFFGGNESNRGGVRVAIKNLDNDDYADLVIGAGDGAGSTTTGYLGKFLRMGETSTPQFSFDAFPNFPHGIYVG